MAPEIVWKSHISILLGAGFSCGHGYPAAAALNKKIYELLDDFVMVNENKFRLKGDVPDYEWQLVESTVREFYWECVEYF